MSDIVKINKKQISSFVQEAGKLVFKKEAEEALVQLIDAIDYLNSQLDEVKANIAKAGLSISEDFNGVDGKNLIISYKETGDRYSCVNDEFLKTISYKRPDPQAIDTYLEREKKLPIGVNLVERTKKVTITRRKNEITA